MNEPIEYGNHARELFLSGYNCSQSVAGAFADLTGYSAKELARMISAFGGGMGRLREVCGCVSGMFFILGILYGYDDPSVYDGKKELYQRVQELAGTFRLQNGSIVCRELLGAKKGADTSSTPEKRTDEYYKKRPCPTLAASAAVILAEYIQAHPVKTPD